MFRFLRSWLGKEAATEDVEPLERKDPRWERGVKEARERWPDFVSAFRARRKGDREFRVKSPFGAEGVLDYAWILVDSINDEEAIGMVMGDLRIREPRRGEIVTISVMTIIDWAFERDGQIQGAFIAQAWGHTPGSVPERR